MTFSFICSVLGAVGMFLVSVEMMGEAVKSMSSDGMSRAIRSLTGSNLRAAACGLTVTAAVQSSCFSTVVLLGLVESGAVMLERAFCVVMGANIGTTVTSVICSIKLSAAAPLLLFISAMIKLTAKSRRLGGIINIFCFFFLLLLSIEVMQNEFMRLPQQVRDSLSLVITKSRLSGFLCGLLLTSVMQSSSASVGLMQSAAASVFLPPETIIYSIFGQNIGACVPVLLASVPLGKNAKKTAAFHLLFNIATSLIFIPIAELTPYPSLLSKIQSPRWRISVAHIFFNVLGTAVFLALFYSRNKIRTVSREK